MMKEKIIKHQNIIMVVLSLILILLIPLIYFKFYNENIINVTLGSFNNNLSPNASKVCPKNSKECELIINNTGLRTYKRLIIKYRYSKIFKELIPVEMDLGKAIQKYDVNAENRIIYEAIKVYDKKYLAVLSIYACHESLDIYDINSNRVNRIEKTHLAFTKDGIQYDEEVNNVVNDNVINSIVARGYEENYVGKGKYGDKKKTRDILSIQWTVGCPH